MKIAKLLITFTLLLLFTQNTYSAKNGEEESTSGALTAMDQFIDSFNNRDIDSWSKSLNYPHVRFASGSVKVWPDRETFVRETDLTPLIESGWDHSHWLSRKVIMSSPGKVHISTIFQRFNNENMPISSYQSLYIVTLINGHWGVQARSSLAP
jgi:hypothetical protein